MEQETIQHRSSSGTFGWMLLAGLLLGGLAVFPSVVQATTIYSYIDEQGNPRFSDSMDNIPEKYRAKVKTHEQATPQERPLSVLDSARAMVPTSAIASFKQKVVELLQGFGIPVSTAASKTGTPPSPSSDMSSSQSRILNYAGTAAVVLLLMMYFSKSQLMRLLGLCLLVTLGIATPILLYVSDDGPMTTMRNKANVVGQAQQDRLKQVGP